jgi:hypothetical protein
VHRVHACHAAIQFVPAACCPHRHTNAKKPTTKPCVDGFLLSCSRTTSLLQDILPSTTWAGLASCHICRPHAAESMHAVMSKWPTPQTERCPTRVYVPSHTHLNITIKVSVSRTRAVTHMTRQMIACRGRQSERLGVTPAHEQAAGTASCNTKSHARTLIRFAECRCKHRQQQQPTRDSHKKSVI